MISGKNALTCYPTGLRDAPERTCKVCGKTFRAGEQYAYKLWSDETHKKHDWYCSYTCYRTVTKPLEERQKAQFERIQRDAVESEDRRREYARALYQRQKERKQRQTKAAKEREKKQSETVAQMIARMKRESERRKKQKTRLMRGNDGWTHC